METMPIKYEDYSKHGDGLHDFGSTSSATSDMLLAEDIWRSLEDDYSEIFCSAFFDDIDGDLKMDDPLDSLFAEVEEVAALHKDVKLDEDLLTKHDCMWGGNCDSREHPENLADSKLLWPIGATPDFSGSPCKGFGYQQSLLKPPFLRSTPTPVMQMVTPSMITPNMSVPQTPPMSDDEDKHNVKHTQVLKLSSNLENNNDEADEDLRKYFGEPIYADFEQNQSDEENEEEEASPSSSSSSSSSSSESEEDEPQAGPSTSYAPHTTSIKSNVYATVNDHSYHKDKNASMRMDNLGIDTPSDSEEEIDVVSVPDAGRMSYALPTNPSVSDRRHFQKTMQSAMTTGRRRNNNTNGLKIMLPTKRPAPPAASAPAAKRRAASTNDNKTNKRTRQYNRVANPTPYRRRGQYGHESESEPEPSEKRNLHNNMERQRRIDLRNAFEYLRQLVPEVLKKERAAKVVILREAAKYCDHLTYQSTSINRQLNELKNHQERLRMRVSMLRRNLALKR